MSYILNKRLNGILATKQSLIAVSLFVVASGCAILTLAEGSEVFEQMKVVLWLSACL